MLTTVSTATICITTYSQARIARNVADAEAEAPQARGAGGGRSRRSTTSSAPLAACDADALTTPAFLEELKLHGFVTSSIEVGAGTQLVRLCMHLVCGIWYV